MIGEETLLTALGASAYAVPALAFLALYQRLRKRSEHRAVASRDEAVSAGLVEPSSLHPLIDPGKCIGCGACVSACPEGTVLGLIDRKAELVSPAHCIGHGACAAACPLQAIALVFGTETRGVDIPRVEPNFETNVSGLFIAGELGGMGLIRNAVEQGSQAVDSARKYAARDGAGELDLLIVGAGPAGIAASLAATQHGLRFETVEQDSLGGTVSHYPRNKIVMTAPVRLPIVGKVRIKEITKEALLAFWEDIERKAGLKIRYQERVERVVSTGSGFEVKTTRAAYRAKSVLLAIGRRGTPRTLGVPGEDMSKVVYRMIDPEQYRNQHVLVVGGGDSAIEAATSIAEQPGTSVTLSYRGDSFNRAKQKNRERLADLESRQRIDVLLATNLKTIADAAVEIDCGGSVKTLRNDAVIICAGGILPTAFLNDIGVEVETKHGTA